MGTKARAITNKALGDMIAKIYPSFKSHTAQLTAETFTERGFDRITQLDPTFVNDFFELSMRVWLNVVNISHAKDILAEKDFGETYDQPWGAIIQRLSTNSVKPISPGWVGLKDGDAPDPFVVRKPVVAERFWKQNFDYASMITVPDDFQMKQIFVSEYGMSEFMAGIMEGLQNGYTTQVYLNKLEALNAAINSTKTPLRPNQIQPLEMSETPTDEQLRGMINAIKKIVAAMCDLGPQTDAFNAYGFNSTQDRGRLRLLLRQGYLPDLETNTLYAAFNRDNLETGIPIIQVPNFGGITYTDGTNPLYPVYNSMGERIGWNTVANQTTVTVTDGNAVAVDPNADVMAVLADKGVVFECRQNPYTVEPIRNPRGRYVNYWSSSPNNTIAYDSLYNMVVFKKATPGG
jgi:hypothetical protein|nr:MAG TPA: Head protein [Caudoviricetes sp.]